MHVIDDGQEAAPHRPLLRLKLGVFFNLEASACILFANLGVRFSAGERANRTFDRNQVIE